MRKSHLHGAFSSSENEGTSQGGGHGFRQGVGALTEGGRERNVRVVGDADPYRGKQEQAGYKYAFSGGRRWQPKADG